MASSLRSGSNRCWIPIDESNNVALSTREEFSLRRPCLSLLHAAVRRRCGCCATFMTFSRHRSFSSSCLSASHSPLLGRFYSFAPLTFIPMQKKLLDQTLLTSKELDWLDEYHEMVSFPALQELSSLNDHVRREGRAAAHTLTHEQEVRNFGWMMPMLPGSPRRSWCFL